ncbi:hypothetical protein MHJ85_02855 [Brevibacterium ravenspurgense]|uniref:hypothetical protein n=1 Tax=Brevibacterium ravenspurgense TaxID=479117 RepID=UPI001EF32BD7|nr:hypothetical protein [Brevibacterium ravenspurgense]
MSRHRDFRGSALPPHAPASLTRWEQLHRAGSELLAELLTARGANPEDYELRLRWVPPAGQQGLTTSMGLAALAYERTDTSPGIIEVNYLPLRALARTAQERGQILDAELTELLDLMFG